MPLDHRSQPCTHAELVRAYVAAKVAAASVSFEDAPRDPVWAALLRARVTAERAALQRVERARPIANQRQEALCI